jgi:hypothetical protein
VAVKQKSPQQIKDGIMPVIAAQLRYPEPVGGIVPYVLVTSKSAAAMVKQA